MDTYLELSYYIKLKDLNFKFSHFTYFGFVINTENWKEDG